MCVCLVWKQSVCLFHDPPRLVPAHAWLPLIPLTRSLSLFSAHSLLRSMCFSRFSSLCFLISRLSSHSSYRPGTIASDTYVLFRVDSWHLSADQCLHRGLLPARDLNPGIKLTQRFHLLAFVVIR